MSKIPFNGHESYSAWNVSLWVSNDEYMYSRATNMKRGPFARQLLRDMPRTPDGVKVSFNTAALAWDDCNTE